MSQYRDPEWIEEKMFGEEFDSPIIYYVVDIADEVVLHSGTFEDCKKFKQQNSTAIPIVEIGIKIIDYSQLTKEMIDSITEPF